VDGGYRADQVVSAEAFPNFTKYATPASQLAFYDAAERRLETLPGVVSVAVTNAVPLSAITPGATPILIKGEAEAADHRPTADFNVSSPDYFATLGIPLLEGRDFTAADTPETPAVAIVNARMARYWSGRSPMGAQISPDGGKTWLTIVGVAGDTRQYGVGHEIVPEVFTPLAQSQGAGGRFIVRTQGSPAAFASALADAIHAVDPDMPVKNVVTLPELRERALATPRLTALLLAIFAALALAVSLAGLGGVIAMSVTHRLKEFGLRLALGATREHILGSVLREGLWLVGAGIGVGLVVANVATRVLSSYLYDTRPTDPATIALVCVTFALTGAAACLGPALRATNADPLSTLKTD
jgi:predicted permease